MKKIIAAIKGGKEFKASGEGMPNPFVNQMYHSLDETFTPIEIDYPIEPESSLYDELTKRKDFTTYFVFDKGSIEIGEHNFFLDADIRINKYFRLRITEVTYKYQILTLE